MQYFCPMTTARPFSKYQKVKLEIHELAFEGKGISKVPSGDRHYIVFVPNVIKGQIVEVQIIKSKNNYAEAKLLKVIEKSPLEVDRGFHSIPGAPYMNLPIHNQAEYKRQSALELYRRIGKKENIEDIFDEYLESPTELHYRNKMEYSFSSVIYNPIEDSFEDGFALGFKKRGQWLAVEPLTSDSGLFDKTLEDALSTISQFFKDAGHTAWHAKKHTGFCRFLTVRKSVLHDKILVNFSSNSSELDRFDSNAFINLIKEILGERLAGLVHTINDDIGDRPKTTDGVQKVLFGQDFIEEEINNLKFKISLESFFQTNPKSAERLYNKALDYVFESDLGEQDVVLDLFSGTGTITQLLSQRAKDKKIIGVEIVSEAVKDAKLNAEANGIKGLEFYCNDVGKFLLDKPEYTNKIGTMVMDPPRAGIAPKTLRKLIRLNAKRMVYISCNPATQARDVEILEAAGYEFKKLSLVDQFPHTSHIEAIALFEKL